MRYLPVNLDVAGKAVIVVGGGAVAARKCGTLLAAGAQPTVIAPALDPALESFRAAGKIFHLRRPYRPGDVAGAFLVYAATSDRDVNAAVARDACGAGILCEVVDAPAAGSFTTPAAVARGDLVFTVSTGGRCPAYARRMRMELEERFGSEYGKVLDIVAAVREKLLTRSEGAAYNETFFRDLMERDLASPVRRGSFEEIDSLLVELFGPDFSLAALGIDKEES